MYWVLWLLFGLAIELIYCIFALPKIYRHALKAIGGSGKNRTLGALVFDVCLSTPLFLLVFTVATFAYQVKGGFRMGSGAAPFVVWTLFVFVGALVVLFGVLLALIKKGESNGEKIDLRFVLPKSKLRQKDKLYRAIYVLFVIAVLIASLMMGLCYDYATITLGTKAAGYLLVGLLAVEALIIAVVERKKLRGLKDVLPRSLIPLLAAFVVMYIMLVIIPEQIVDWVLLACGVAVLFAVAVFWLCSLVMRKFFSK